MHRALVSVVRFALPIVYAIAIGYLLIALGPLIGELFASAMTPR
jgi:hypothetical protein